MRTSIAKTKAVDGAEKPTRGQGNHSTSWAALDPEGGHQVTIE